MREFEVVQLAVPVLVTSSGLTGAYKDLQGFVNPGGRELKFVLNAGLGTTVGTCGGSIQSASDTAGTGLATVVTFSTLTASGGQDVAHGVVPAGHRYIRFLGTAASGKSMLLSAEAIGLARVSP